MRDLTVFNYNRIVLVRIYIISNPIYSGALQTELSTESARQRIFYISKIFFYHIDNINLLAFHKTIERTAVRNKSIQMAIIGYVHVEKQEASNTADNTFAA